MRLTVWLLHTDPNYPAYKKLSVSTVVCYSPEKNIRYVTELTEHFIALHFVFNVFWDPGPVKIVSVIVIYTLELDILEYTYVIRNTSVYNFFHIFFLRIC